MKILLNETELELSRKVETENMGVIWYILEIRLKANHLNTECEP